MRAIFSILGLVIVVAIIGVLAKKQLSAGVAPAVPATAGAPGAPVLTGTPQQQQQQFKNAVESAVQQPRPMPEESK